ncbi:peptide ABC transporter permease [Enemella evansiae]|uniref:Peptide ABC transporter permease n=1 Tax=Enemella evansiae TaxID=2016499 RepID=A0A255GAI9_9ACTN|nr:ABC transporter permease [Enemella evansiae]OYO12950.1 peptide ABC transporter permease [Enemella evansiae]
MRDTLRRLLTDPTGLLATVLLIPFLITALFAPLIAPYGADEMIALPLQPPSWTHLLGTDELGRDLFSRVVYATPTSMAFGLVATVVALAIGLPWGLLSGWYGGWFDLVSMRLTDAILAFPQIILAMAVIAVLGPSAPSIMIAIGVVQVPRFTRLVRAELLGLKNREFVQAADGFGASTGHLLRRSILPNLRSTIVVQFTLTFATAVLTEASLSYLGLGIQPPTPAWGSMLQTSRNFVEQSPGYGIFTGGVIFLAVLCFSLLGDGIRDVTDTRRR